MALTEAAASELLYPPAEREVRRGRQSLAVQAGADPNACEFCERPLTDAEGWTRGLDGHAYHNRCMAEYLGW